MANTGKSGYEIRADLLNQAQCILQDNQQRAADAIMYNNEYSDNKEFVTFEPLKVEDVIGLAKELNDFVTSM